MSYIPVGDGDSPYMRPWGLVMWAALDSRLMSICERMPNDDFPYDVDANVISNGPEKTYYQFQNSSSLETVHHIKKGFSFCGIFCVKYTLSEINVPRIKEPRI